MSQNLLVNVFRPTYVYDQTKGYIPKLVLTSVDNVIGTNFTVSNLNIGDDSNNVYVGTNAGNSSTLVATCNSTRVTAVGVNAGSNNSNCLNDVYLGASAGCNTTNVSNSFYGGYLTGNYNSNCTNSVYIGHSIASNLSGISNEVAIGANAIAGGNSNVYVGASTGSTGSSNVFLGAGIAPGSVSSQVRIGRGTSIPFFANMSSQLVGINNTSPEYSFDVSGDAYFRGKIGIQAIPDKTLDINGQTRSTGGFISDQGTSTVSTTAVIGPVKRGVIIASALDTGSEANYGAYSFIATSTSNIVEISSARGGDTYIQRSGSNIIISNANSTKSYVWNITYLPLDSV